MESTVLVHCQKYDLIHLITGRTIAEDITEQEAETIAKREDSELSYEANWNCWTLNPR